jgi:hypothetical protein
MTYWIKRIAAILAITAFFALLFSGLAGSGTFSLEVLVPILLRSTAGAALCWILGIVVADIVLKGIVSDIVVDTDNLVDGGLLQRVHIVKERAVPGGPDMPFEQRGKPGKKNKAGREK